MKIIENAKIENKIFNLEDVVFINCEVSGCDLFYSGGDFEWSNTVFHDCRFHFRGAAANTRTLMFMMNVKPSGSVTQPSPVTSSIN